MMITTHRCDFCAAKRHPAKMAKLTVPLTKEEIELRRKTEAPLGTPVQRSRYRSMFDYIGMLDGQEPEERTVTFDMCEECVKGILAARFREIRRLVAEEPNGN